MTKTLRLEPLMQTLLQRSDWMLVVALAAVIALLVFPLSPAALDSLIAANLAVSVGLLMMAFYVPSALGLSTFPTLLLLTTLFRLSLNIASTKQILLHADAGRIIDTFGNLIVNGNVIVGGVVFLIIAIVQFVVIAKGSERVAEVAARFTLDAMPGKQMSIDADLRAGIIGVDEARARRAHLEQESQLHGAMDGAMKFVKGDAIAAIIIAAINILAGIAIGSLMHGMSVGEAAERYCVLTVGDGMVSQIPSLLVSVAAGILITRVSTGGAGDHLGGQIARQLLAQPKAMLVTGGLLLGFAVVPGLPGLPFVCLAMAIGGVGLFLQRRAGRELSYEHTLMPAMKREGTTNVPQLIAEADSVVGIPLLLKIAPQARQYLAAPVLDDELRALRRRLRLELGLPFPGMRIVYDESLASDGYLILVQEIPAASGRLVGRGESENVPQPEPRDAAFTIEAAHPLSMAPALRMPIGGTGAEVKLASELDRVLRSHAATFIGIQEVQDLIKQSERELPELTAELLRAVSLQRIADVMRRLVGEGISIRNLREIFESLIAWNAKEKDPVMLTEYVRIDLGRHTAYKYAQGRNAPLEVLILDGKAEAVIRQSIQQSAAGGYLALAPEQVKSLTERIRQALAATQLPLLLLTSMDIRRYVKKLLEPVLPALPVLSYQEIGNHALVQTRERIQL